MEENKRINKKAWIIAGAVLIACVILLTLMGSLVSYRKTEFVFKNQKDELIDTPTSFDRERATESLSALKGKNLMFLGDSEIKSRVETVSDVKVISVVKVFPDTVRIYLAQRNAVYYYKDASNGLYYVFDEMLRVFAIRTLNPGDSVVRVTGFGLSDFSCLEQDETLAFISGSEWKADVLKTVADTFWTLGIDYGSAGDLISLFDLSADKTGSYTLTLELQTGGKFIVPDPEVNLSQRIVNLYGVFLAGTAPKDGEFYVNTEGTVYLKGN